MKKAYGINVGEKFSGELYADSKKPPCAGAVYWAASTKDLSRNGHVRDTHGPQASTTDYLLIRWKRTNNLSLAHEVIFLW